jgi:hypothetical protein
MNPPYVIDWEGIERCFPPGLAPSPLLRDFSHWLGEHSWGSVGCFDLRGSFSDDAPILDGRALRREFALFMSLPDGSRAGFWYRPGLDPLHTPIVGLGSQGQAGILADSLEAFLARIALNDFQDENTWSDFAPHEDEEDDTPLLAAWLRRRLATDDLASIAEPVANRPDFSARMEAWTHDRESYWPSHPLMVKLSGLLGAYRPKGKEPWHRTHFGAVVVGSAYQLRVFERGPQPVPEAAEIEPLLRALRTEMWHADRDMGLWLSIEFYLFADGTIMPRFNYDARSTYSGTLIDLAQASTDMTLAPRSERWAPIWLAERSYGGRKPGEMHLPSDNNL